MDKNEKLKLCRFYTGVDLDPYEFYGIGSYSIECWSGEKMWVSGRVNSSKISELLETCPLDLKFIGLPRDLVVCLYLSFASVLNKGSMEPVPRSVRWTRFSDKVLPLYLSASRTE